MKQKRLHRCAPLPLAIILFGCLPTAGTRPPDWSSEVRRNPNSATGANSIRKSSNKIFQPCDGTFSSNPASRAFGAMLLSLQEREWTIRKMDAQSHHIEANICYRNDPTYCATTTFDSDKYGRNHAKPTYVHPKLEDDLQRWFVALEQTYSKYRCFTDAALRTEMNKYGFTL